MSYTQDDCNNALSQILDSFGTLLADLENVDKKDRQKIFEVLVDHIVAEMQIIYNTKFKLGTPNYIDSRKLEETRRRFYNIVGYSFNDSSLELLYETNHPGRIGRMDSGQTEPVRLMKYLAH